MIWIVVAVFVGAAIGWASCAIISMGSDHELRRLGEEWPDGVTAQGFRGETGCPILYRETMELRPKGVPQHIAPEVATTEVPEKVPEKKPRARRARKTGEVKT